MTSARACLLVLVCVVLLAQPVHPATAAGGEIRLTCRDAIQATVPPPAGASSIRVSGIVFTHVNSTGRSGLEPRDKPYFFVKAFLYVTAAAPTPIVVSVLSPPSARLYYVDSDTWSQHPSPNEMIRDARKTEVFATHCTDELQPYVGYTGGILVSRHSQAGSQAPGTTGAPGRRKPRLREVPRDRRA
jgi:hypothetical protein